MNKTETKAFVRCSDGKCYPCIVLAQMPDLKALLPAVLIKFIDQRPEYTNRVIVVNMLVVTF